MGFSASWYTQHPMEETKNVSLDGISLEQFDGVVKKATLSNQDRQADAISKADSYSFQVANPWFKRTASNTKLVNHWLTSKGINDPTFPDFIEATSVLANTGLLDIDEAAYASHLDNNGPKQFKGALTGRTYESLDALIAQERQAAIEQLGAEKQSDLERAFDHLPLEDAQALLRDAEKRSQSLADGKISQQNADAWLTLNPTWRDDEANAKLMREQLILNGVTGVVTINDYQIAERQLVAAGLVRQNPAALRKQQAQEVLDRAEHAVKNSAAFDTTSEDAMYELPLDEVRRRANGNYTGVGY